MLTALAKAGWAGDAAALDSSYVGLIGLPMAGKGGEGAGHRSVAR